MTWYTDPATDTSAILSSRVRLARNLKKYPFRQRLTAADAQKMIKETIDAVINDRTALSYRFTAAETHRFSEIDKQVYLEKHIISPAFINDEEPSGLLLQDDENVSIMINEEDHIRIQTISPGADFASCWEMAGHIDDLIEESVAYAFDRDYGYLTACPTNTGTGLRASFMIHLPMLERTGQLKNLLPAISKFGVAIRGLHGEGTESMGGIYQISNQITLGKSEQEIMQGLYNVTQQVIEKENQIREKMLDKHRADIENNIYRAYGVLAYSKKTTIKEAMDLLSEIRLGYTTGLLDLPRLSKNIYQIMIEIQPGHLQKQAGMALDQQACDTMRADCMRVIFKQNTQA